MSTLLVRESRERVKGNHQSSSHEDDDINILIMFARKGEERTMNEIECHIKEILCRTIEYLHAIYPTEGTPYIEGGPRRLIFPSYGDEEKDGELRVSEQELRFTFVDMFNDYCDKLKKEKDIDFKYSVETPTNGKYRFKDTDNPHIDDDGISGNLDLVIHDQSGERLCLIEFKANNPELKEIEKDLVKLTNKEERDRNTGNPIPRYFIGLVKSSQPERTKKSIKEKFDIIHDKPKDKRNSEEIHVLFFNLIEGKILYEERFSFKYVESEQRKSPDTLNNWLKDIK